METIEDQKSIEVVQGLVDTWWTKLHHPKAFDEYGDSVLDMITQTKARVVMELGAGRSPSFDLPIWEKLGVSYVAADISQRELDLAPSWAKKACFDLSGKNPEHIADFAQSCDLVFSRMLMEHVPDDVAAYRNIAAILRPGGISIAFHPVLFSVPFVANYLLPETLSAAILKSVFPHRSDTGIPKFPARYAGCRISKGIRQRIKDTGFRQVWQVPFWGHNYYSKFPVMRDIHAVVNKAIASNKIEPLATFSYTIAIK